MTPQKRAIFSLLIISLDCKVFSCFIFVRISKHSSNAFLSPISPLLRHYVMMCLLCSDVQEFYTFVFLSAECKSSWEAYFEEAKQKLGKFMVLT